MSLIVVILLTIIVLIWRLTISKVSVSIHILAVIHVWLVHPVRVAVIESIWTTSIVIITVLRKWTARRLEARRLKLAIIRVATILRPIMIVAWRRRWIRIRCLCRVRSETKRKLLIRRRLISCIALLWWTGSIVIIVVVVVHVSLLLILSMHVTIIHLEPSCLLHWWLISVHILVHAISAIIHVHRWRWLMHFRAHIVAIWRCTMRLVSIVAISVVIVVVVRLLLHCHWLPIC